MPKWSLLPYLSYFITVLLKHPTWPLSDVITSNLNLFGWSWWRMYVHRHGMMMYVRATSRVWSRIHYINLDLRHHFLICGYGIFPSLRHTISYPWTMSAYNLCIFFSLCLHALYKFFYHFTLSPRYILSCFLLSPCCIRFLLLLSPCWTWFLLGLT